MIQAVLFDLDGTLADTAILTMAAFQAEAPRAGLAVPTEEQVRSAIGWANPEFYHKIYPQGPADTVAQMGERIEALELELLPGLKTDLLFAGVRDMLQALHSAGVALYIASTGSAEHVYAILNHAGLRPLFTAIACDKPDKIEMIRPILTENRLKDAVMVGDKPKDSDGARASGIPSVGACWGYCAPGEGGFDSYVHTPAQLAERLLNRDCQVTE